MQRSKISHRKNSTHQVLGSLNQLSEINISTLPLMRDDVSHSYARFNSFNASLLRYSLLLLTLLQGRTAAQGSPNYNHFGYDAQDYHYYHNTSGNGTKRFRMEIRTGSTGNQTVFPPIDTVVSGFRQGKCNLTEGFIPSGRMLGPADVDDSFFKYSFFELFNTRYAHLNYPRNFMECMQQFIIESVDSYINATRNQTIAPYNISPDNQTITPFNNSTNNQTGDPVYHSSVPPVIIAIFAMLGVGILSVISLYAFLIARKIRNANRPLHIDVEAQPQNQPNAQEMDVISDNRVEDRKTYVRFCN